MAERQSVNFPGFAHGNPIPNASRIGNIMMSSVISGVDPGTRNLPSDLAGQVKNHFIHIRSAVDDFQHALVPVIIHQGPRLLLVSHQPLANHVGPIIRPLNQLPAIEIAYSGNLGRRFENVVCLAI